MGSIIEFPTFYDHMSGKDNLQFHCEYMGYYNKDRLMANDVEIASISQHTETLEDYFLKITSEVGR